MGLGFELKLEQTQKLIMTPELQQAITLLQYSFIDLVDYVRKELVNNPVLELDDIEEEKELAPKRDELKEPTSLTWEEYFQEHDYYHNYTYRNSNVDDDRPGPESFISKDYSLEEHLLFQLQLSAKNSRQYYIGEYLIGNIDHNGYLQGDLSELSNMLGVNEGEALEALQLIQTFEPTGVGARNLQECLKIQLQEKKIVPRLASVIIDHHLPEVAEGRLRLLAEKLGAEINEIQDTVDFIKSLNPKPGCIFGDPNDTRYVVPDVVVEKVEDDYYIIVNDSLSPHLTINPFYKSLLKGSTEQKASAFIKNKLDSALWLIRSIEQRRITLYKVMEQIVRFQEEFFRGGVTKLKPLTLKQVAEEVGIHESTVSRAISNKFVQTPRGTYPLKFFFSSGIQSSNGGQFSTLSVKHYLKELVAKERPDKPFSDQKLAQLLQQKGISISRRTVAKYREELGIPASFRRRRV